MCISRSSSSMVNEFYMKYTALTNPFTHICCGCGLTHKVFIKINKKGELCFAFVGDKKKSLKNFKTGVYYKDGLLK